MTNMENMGEIIGYLMTAVGTLGGWECIKYLLNRKTNKRKEEAEADSKEFDNMRDQLEFMSAQMKEQQVQITELMRDKNELQKKIIELSSEVARLNSILNIKKCDKPNCKDRVPPTGY